MLYTMHVATCWSVRILLPNWRKHFTTLLLQFVWYFTLGGYVLQYAMLCAMCNTICYMQCYVLYAIRFAICNALCSMLVQCYSNLFTTYMQCNAVCQTIWWGTLSQIGRSSISARIPTHLSDATLSHSLLLIKSATNSCFHLAMDIFKV